MKELVVISGKGGTGKTSVTAALAALSTNAVCADCDVDAADLHLLLDPQIERDEPFISGNIARIDAAVCDGCRICYDLCRFEAINSGAVCRVNSTACEGCGVCVHFCPQQCIEFPPRRCGQWFISSSRFGIMVHAALDIGAENSGKLVSLVRREARAMAQQQGSDLIIVDGPPGIGCPVIAATTGADAVLVVSEPTCSGEHDLKRVLKLCSHFAVPAYVCVNKWDINAAMSDVIKAVTQQHGAEFIGTIPYDKQITAAQIAGKTVVEIGNSAASVAITQIWAELCSKMDI